MRKLPVLLAFFAVVCGAADWLNYGGDPQHSGWQKRGKSIQPGNVGELKLLWKRTLDNQSKGLNSLTAPVMLGPIITHRGVKELVFVGGASDNIFAVDADLGRVFWKRHIDSDAAGEGCGSGLTATPVLAPPPPGTKIREDDEGTTPMRPFYIVASDGVLHTIRPADGVDMAPAQRFLPPHANPSALNLWGKVVYTTTSHGCRGVPDGVWSIDTANPEAKATFEAMPGASGGVSIGLEGTIYHGGVAPIPFPWKGRELAAGQGGLTVPGAVSGLATWVDPNGARWIYAAGDGKIAAFRVVEKSGAVTLAPDWVSRDLGSPLAPVIQNGVVFALDSGEKSGHAVLYALDAHTGKQLYSSGDAVTSVVHSSALAIANGHICFGTADNTLYCFGFPIEI
ncbi:MAG: Pyrrolo-quinoline quinone [Bryobacterales bacterium]|nr:Pyrrolo-quinoline quinone [Bryobacterales bacterium]